MDITVYDPAGAEPGDLAPENRPDWDWQPTTIADRPAQCADLIDRRRCAVDAGEFVVNLGFGSLTADELDRTVAGMTVATWDDPDTWYDVEAAVPDR